MIALKNEEEIKVMREGGRRLREVLEKVLSEVKPGVSKAFLNQIAEAEIEKQRGKASFKMVPGYSWATCITINDEVVHGIPQEEVLENGDIVGVDIGIYYKGFHTDLATTVVVGNGKIQGKKKFLGAGERALKRAIKEAKVGNFVADISLAIQNEIESSGYSTVKNLTGHGVGRQLHEQPSIPMFFKGSRKKTVKIKKGMTLAIEVIYNQGSDKVVLENDGWTISTLDGKISGLFEESVAVMGDGPLILTR
jgi:methionyl aminopeptidase